MVWLILALACGVGAAVRLFLIPHRSVWALAFTGTFVAIVIGAGFRLAADWFGLSWAQSASLAAFVLAGGAVNVYVYALRVASPAPRVVAGHLVVGGAVAATTLAAYASRLVEGSVIGAIVFYDLVPHLFLALCLSNVAVCAWRRRNSAGRADPSRRWGLMAVTLGAVLVVLGQLGYTAAAFLLPAFDQGVADGLVAAGMCVICLGSIAFVVVPRLLGLVVAARLRRRLLPLWRRLVELVPAAELPWPAGAPASAREQAERMVIEIHDALAALRLGESRSSSGPYAEVIAARLLTAKVEASGPRLVDLVPPSPDRGVEADQLQELAAAYVRMKACTHGAVDGPANSNS